MLGSGQQPSDYQKRQIASAKVDNAPFQEERLRVTGAFVFVKLGILTEKTKHAKNLPFARAKSPSLEMGLFPQSDGARKDL
jgi:hypothetical protein